MRLRSRRTRCRSAVGLEPQHGRRLAALALIALAITETRTEVAQVGNDLADGGVGEIDSAGEVGLRSLAEPAAGAAG